MNLGECEVRRVRLDVLEPAQYNPRRMPERAMRRLGASMDRFGVLVPIVWNERTGHIVGGHQRYAKLVEDGEEETDVVVVDLDEREEMALNIALNSRHLRGDFTKEAVGLLERAAEGLGEAFSDIGLDDLHNFLSRIKFEGDGSSGCQDSGGEPSPSPEPLDEDSGVIVTCPRCHGSWDMASGKVVDDAPGQMEDQEGGG
jgi:hypothetical protein